MTAIQTTTSRRFDLDWLRVIMIGIIFLFHTGRFFDTLDWHVKNAETSTIMQYWTTFLASWIMPVIFVISGASIFLTLQKNDGLQFIKERFFRLFVPLIAGVFTHIPLQVYLERINHHQFYGSFIQFIPHYFKGLYGEGGNFAWMGLHLWYLLILFIFSIFLFPLFSWLSKKGNSILKKIGDILALPGFIYLLAVPVVLIFTSVSPYTVFGARNWGGWSLLSYIPFLIYGFIIFSNQRLQQTIQESRWVSISLAGSNLIVMIYAFRNFPFVSFHTPEYFIVNGSFALNAWLMTLAILGFGMKNLQSNNRLIKQANEIVMPFYILHQTVLLVVGSAVVDWSLPVYLKFIIIFLFSFTVTVSLIKFLILPFNFLRFLFGMKPQISSVEQPGTPEIIFRPVSKAKK